MKYNRENVRISEKGKALLDDRILSQKVSLVLAKNTDKKVDGLVKGITIGNIIVKYASSD